MVLQKEAENTRNRHVSNNDIFKGNGNEKNTDAEDQNDFLDA